MYSSNIQQHLNTALDIRDINKELEQNRLNVTIITEMISVLQNKIEAHQNKIQTVEKELIICKYCLAGTTAIAVVLMIGRSFFS